VPSEALSACLYDINTDELRFVSVAGFAANDVQGKAVPRSAGLLGQALRNEHRATTYGDVLLEPAFNPEIDSRPGLDARSMLLCAVAAEGHLLGGLQLINRTYTHRYDQADANVVGYVAERLGEFLHASRRRAQSEPAPPRR
jgi:GAF domain-containing protein